MSKNILLTKVSDLTNEDLAQLQTLRRVFLLQHVLFLILAVLLSLLSGLFWIRDFGYLTGVGFTFLFLIVVYLIFFARQYFEYWKDNKHQKKICADIVVVKKIAKRGDRYIVTDNPVIKKANLYSNQQFDRIHPGMTLYIEVSKHSRYLLRLEQRGETLA